MAIPGRILDGIGKLEPLPITVQRLVSMLHDEDINMKEVVSIVEYDEAIASNILRIANSAAYAGRFEIKNLRDAVVRLGMTVLLGISLNNYLKSVKFSAPMYDLSENDLWLHASATSLAVKAIVQESGNSKIPQISNIAGLIHDIGKLIMVRFLKADVSVILDECKEKDISFVEAEKELWGYDHAEVGAVMAKKWNFPEPIILAIEEHHQVSPQKPSLIVDVVILGNIVAKSIGVGLGAEGMNLRTDLAGCRERIGLTLEKFERVCAQTACWLVDLKKEFGISA